MNIPKVKDFPDNSVQCNKCGGHGCDVCEERGWLTPRTHPAGRQCYRDGCNKPIPPDQVAVYCSNECAKEDA